MTRDQSRILQSRHALLRAVASAIAVCSLIAVTLGVIGAPAPAAAQIVIVCDGAHSGNCLKPNSDGSIVAALAGIAPNGVDITGLDSGVQCTQAAALCIPTTVPAGIGIVELATNSNDLEGALKLGTLTASKNAVCTDSGKILITTGCLAGVADHDAQTAVAGAATSTKANVVVTSEGLTAATTYTLTLTDALVATTSVIQVTATDGAAGGVQIASVTPGSGSVAIVFDMAALTGTIVARISIHN